MNKVDIGSDDFIAGSTFVKLGSVASAIGKILLANGSHNRFQAERDAWTFIHTGIVAGKLHPLAPETLDVLSINEYGNGVVGFDELVEWGRWCHRFDFVKECTQAAPDAKAEYVPLFSLLANYWDKPLSELPKEVQAKGGVFTMLWDELNLVQRQELVSQTDYREDPALAGERHVGWHDQTMDARRWMEMQNVTPKEAAMVLCRLNPHEKYDCENIERIYVDDDKTSPHRYKLLLRTFEDVASTIPKHRTLMEWRTIAQQQNLRYHSWIDDYADAMGALAGNQAAPTPAAKGKTAPAIAGTTSKANDEPPGKMARTEAGKLTIEAAWEIECETGKKTTADIVMDRLQMWANAKPNNHPALIKSIPHGVVWATKKDRKEKNYMIEHCGNHLAEWYKSCI